MKTYSQSTYVASVEAWASGDFDPKWERYRRIAADRGFIFPPRGSKYDDADEDEPSQRAVIWRAIEDRPTELEAIVRRSSSWSQVIDTIFGMNRRVRLEVPPDRRSSPVHISEAIGARAVIDRLRAEVTDV